MYKDKCKWSICKYTCESHTNGHWTHHVSKQILSASAMHSNNQFSTIISLIKLHFKGAKARLSCIWYTNDRNTRPVYISAMTTHADQTAGRQLLDR